MPLEYVDFEDLYTYARAGDAQVLGSSGEIETVAENAPVIEWLPSGAVSGLQIYGATSQLLANTSDPDYWAVNAGNCTQTADAAVAPDGTTTAALLTENTANSSHFAGRNAGLGPLAGSNYTLSVFFKSNGKTRFSLTLFDLSAATNFVRATVNLTLGTATASVGGNGVAVRADMETYPNGWYRVSITGTPNPGSVAGTFGRIDLLNSSGAGNYTGDGTSGLYHWGWNMHTGRRPVPFIATTTAPKTRGADIMTLNSLDTTFGATQGTFYAKFLVASAAPADAHRTILYIDDGTTDNSYDLRMDTGTLTVRLVVRAGGSEVANLVAGTAVAGAITTVAFSYVADAFRISMNGGAAVSDTSGAVPSGITTVRIGSADAAGAAPLAGVLKRFRRRRGALNAADLAAESAI